MQDTRELTPLEIAIERAVKAEQEIYLDTAIIKPGDDLNANDRLIFSEKEIVELADDIKANGQVQAATVRPVQAKDGENYFELVAGHRRWLACKHAGLPLKVIVRNLNDQQASIVKWAENSKRVDLNYMEEARGFQRRMVQFNLSIPELADLVGRQVVYVKRRLALNNLHPMLQELLLKGKRMDNGEINTFSLGLAELLVFEHELDHNFQMQAFDAFMALGDKCNLRAGRSIVKDQVMKQAQAVMFDMSTFMTSAIEIKEKTKKIKAADLPRDDSMPKLDTTDTGGFSPGAMMRRYYQQLVDCGMHDKALTVATVLNEMIDNKVMR